MAMKVLKIAPGQKPEAIEIEQSYKALCNEVQGSLEAIYPFDDPVALVCNEEGKINGMKLNRELRDDDGNRLDIIAGPFLIIGLSEDDVGPLDDSLIEKYSEMFAHPQQFIVMDQEIVCIELDDMSEPNMTM